MYTMNQQVNPFLEHTINRGMMFMDETQRSAAVSRALVASCDEIIMALQSGDIHGAVNAAQNTKYMAGQMVQTTNFLNDVLTERLQVAFQFMNSLQSRVQELAGALNNVHLSRQAFQQPVLHQQATPCICQTSALM